MIWQRCRGAEQIGSVHGILYRLVESQEQVATRHYVDNLDEQALLEDLLEVVKPPHRNDSEGYHYLLKTPFRYPPLRWGSRYGQRHERGIFYGGKSVDTALCEAAFYRLVFFESMVAPPPKSSMLTQHTLFGASYATDFGVTYTSARAQDFRQAICVGLFTPHAFAKRKPLDKNAWLCEVTTDSVQFKALGEREVIRFPRAAFCVDNTLPLPAR
ncbi:MAG: hypothetical protein CSA53_00695 [Gammaproteobacteria bacterium]|nr:MAG: hypothetical protein CSA53_00695 [Gammaproteobacteria bacterium]